MQLHNLTKGKTTEAKQRVGRGGKRGKTSGRGHKGQKQHGSSLRPEMRDMIKKLPKLRGHGVNRARTVNSGKVKPTVVKLSSIVEAKLKEVTPATLVETGLLKKSGNKLPKVKILSDAGTKEVKTKFTVENCDMSQSVAAMLK